MDQRHLTPVRGITESAKVRESVPDNHLRCRHQHFSRVAYRLPIHVDIFFLFNGTELPRRWTDGVEIIGDKRPPTFLAQCHLNFDISIFYFDMQTAFSGNAAPSMAEFQKPSRCHCKVYRNRKVKKKRKISRPRHPERSAIRSHAAGAAVARPSPSEAKYAAPGLKTTKPLRNSLRAELNNIADLLE